MATETISYSEAGQGWDSFHSFIPDWMIGLNSSMYSWKGGELYKHDTNASRNNYYGVAYSSTITPIFNQNPLDNKIFKTLGIDGNSPWKSEIATDFTNGIIESDYFTEKEGTWFSHIRRDSGTVDLKAMSTQGVGVGDYSALVFTFAFQLSINISIGDFIYVSSSPSTVPLQLVGTVTGYTGTTITVVAAAFTPNPSGDMVVVVKDSTSESYGIRGSWLKAKLTNDSTSPVELFTISSDTIKSYP